MLIAALCLTAGALAARVPASHVTLRWYHSIEKTEWDEDYTVAGSWLALTGARIRGSGAGMEPPPKAQLVKGVWHYELDDPWRKTVVLARSHYVRDYDLCIDGHCRPLSDWIPIDAGPTTMQACTD